MAKKELGFVELEWTCPNCKGRNPGAARACATCGAPQPKDVQFEQAAEEKIITDEAGIAAAKAGPDIHCAYCGARNVATADICKRCGAALSEGAKREAGQVLGGLRDKPAPDVKCPACGTMNPANARKCSNCAEPLGIRESTPPAQAVPAAPRRGGRGPWILVAAVLSGLVAIAVLAIILGSRRTALVGQVMDVRWQRTIALQALMPVKRETWRDELPGGAQVGQCKERLYRVQDQPAEGARETCGTPYVVDKGSGYGEVVQDCRYEIYADWCDYETVAWVGIAPVVVRGSNMDPEWPAVKLAENQRPAGRTESYSVIFQANDKTYTYEPQTLEEYQRFAPGSSWKLEISGLGGVNVQGPAE